MAAPLTTKEAVALRAREIGLRRDIEADSDDADSYAALGVVQVRWA